MSPDFEAKNSVLYKGKENQLKLSRGYSSTWFCNFDMTNYPFDTQVSTVVYLYWFLKSISICTLPPYSFLEHTEACLPNYLKSVYLQALLLEIMLAHQRKCQPNHNHT